MPDFTGFKLGKKAAQHDKRVPMLAKYTAGILLQAPVAVDYTTHITNLGMMRNDALGDCTCAAVGHCIQEWSAQATEGTGQIIVPDSQIEQLYEIVGHYVPGQPSTDQGAVVIDVLKYWLSHAVDNQILSAFAALEPKNHQDVKDAVYFFGNAYIGLQLPLSAQNASAWTVPAEGPTGNGAPGSWGGHAVPVVAYDDRGLTVITWGQKLTMTWEFWDAYVDEAYALLSPDWISRSGVAPQGLSFQQLESDLQDLRAASLSEWNHRRALATQGGCVYGGQTYGVNARVFINSVPMICQGDGSWLAATGYAKKPTNGPSPSGTGPKKPKQSAATARAPRRKH